MKKLILLPLLLLFYSCAQDEPAPVTDSVDFTPFSAAVQDENSVTCNDLDNLVKGSNPSKSRAGGYTVSTIADSKGTPCIYVLNFNQGGWALVSATRKYQPILAHNDKGSFDVNGNMPGGLMLWKENTVNTISEVDNLVPQDTIEMYKKEWSAISPIARLQGASSSEGVTRPTSRVDHWTDAPVFHSDFTREDYDRLRGIMADSIAQWRRKGYQVETFENVRPLQLLPGPYGDQGITIDDLLRMCDGMTYIFYSENFRFLSCAVYREDNFTEITGPIIQSTWNQDDNYNYSFPVKNAKKCLVGCVPVAVGQLMRYFQHPQKYNWANMPLNYATVATSRFLLEIANEMGTDFGVNKSSTKHENMKNFLKKYYSFSTKENASGPETSRIINGQLCLISAKWDSNKDPEHKHEHTWLSWGHHYIQRMTRNDIYTFTLPDEMTTCGNMEHETLYPRWEAYYMNWGWGGNYDGYYGNSGWCFPGDSDSGKPTRVYIDYGFQKI